MRKGQWFIISAVIVSGAFLTISVLFRSFFSVDTSDIAMLDHDVMLSSIKDGMRKTIEESEPPCSILSRNLDEFKYFSMEKLSEKGYILDMRYDIADCNAKQVDTHLILVSSSSMEVWEGERPEAESVTANLNGNGEAESLSIRLKSPVQYAVAGNMSLYDIGFVDSVEFNIDRGETEATENLPAPRAVSKDAYAKVLGHLFAQNKIFFVG